MRLLKLFLVIVFYVYYINAKKAYQLQEKEAQYALKSMQRILNNLQQKKGIITVVTVPPRKNDFECIDAESCPDFCKIDPEENSRDKYRYGSVKTTTARSIADLTDGLIINKYGKQYFFSSKEATYSNSYRACCKMDMKLITIETIDKLNVIADFTRDAIKNKLSIWTSGLLVRDCNESIWCTTDYLFGPEVPWLNGEPFIRDKKILSKFNDLLGIALYISTKQSSDGVFVTYLSNFMRFICESNVMDKIESSSYKIEKFKKDLKLPFDWRSKIPAFGSGYAKQTCRDVPEELCVNNRRYRFSSRGDVIVDSSEGTLVKACGKQYVFLHNSIKDVGYSPGKICCDMGLKTPYISSLEDLTCIFDAYKDISNKSQIFWSTAKDFKLNREYKFCDGMNNKVVPDDMWLPGEPDNKDGNEFCASFRFSLSGLIGLSDDHCNIKNNFFCEVPSTSSKQNPFELETFTSTSAKPKKIKFQFVDD